MFGYVTAFYVFCEPSLGFELVELCIIVSTFVAITVNINNCLHAFLAVSEPVMVLMACGPYTPSDSLAFDPLIDLIHIINKDCPDICILVRPVYIYCKK